MKTAMITGASEGIGFELAKIFAQNKTGLILVARNGEKLKEMANDLSKDGIEVKIYSKDLSKIQNAVDIYDDIKKKGISVDYLVNNAGFGTNGLFAEIPWEKEVDMFNLNMIALAYFTKVFAMDMKNRGAGKILNVASTAAFQPGPYMAGYCATKSFVLSLSEAVNYELKGTGVTVTTLCPGYTKTKFHEVANTAGTSMSRMMANASANEVAKYGYKIMMNSKSLGIHGVMNKMMAFSVRFSGRKMVLNLASKMLKKA